MMTETHVDRYSEIKNPQTDAKYTNDPPLSYIVLSVLSNLECIRKNSGFNYSFIIYELHLPQPHYSVLCMGYVHYSMCGEAREQLYGIGSFLLPLHGFQLSNLGCSVLVTTTLPIEPPHQQSHNFKVRQFKCYFT